MATADARATLPLWPMVLTAKCRAPTSFPGLFTRGQSKLRIESVTWIESSHDLTEGIFPPRNNYLS